MNNRPLADKVQDFYPDSEVVEDDDGYESFVRVNCPDTGFNVNVFDKGTHYFAVIDGKSKAGSPKLSEALTRAYHDLQMKTQVNA